MEQKSRAKILLKSIRYPTYQLYATAGSNREIPEKQLVICALSVLEWLRTKLQQFDIPEAFNTPRPEDCADVHLSDLKNACQRQAEIVDYRRSKMSFFGGRHSSVYSPFPQLHLPV